MNRKSSSRVARSEYDKQIALVLQGGGALGSYQAGVYKAVAEHGYQPDWVAGISIGAINAAIIAGNAPQDRVARLREFWDQVSSPSASWLDLPLDVWRDTMRRLSAMSALMFGQPGFFQPNLMRCWTTGTLPTSYYDTSDLRDTLERLVDFDRINARETRFSVGAVNVRTGNFAYFDNARQTIRPEHVMASGALPPGFPAIEIDGEFYWDGGLVSNTPLRYILERVPRRSTLVSQCRALRSENRRTGSERRFCGRDDSPRQPVSSRESTGAATAVPVTLELGHAPQTAMAGESGVRHSAARARIFKLYRPARRRLAAVARGGSYRFGGGNGSRIGSGLIFARIASLALLQSCAKVDRSTNARDRRVDWHTAILKFSSSR